MPAVLLQLTGLIFIEIIGQKISMDDLYHLLIGSDKGRIDFELLKSSIPKFILYQTFLILFSVLLGYSIRIAALRFNLDKKFGFLKINNDWYYLFSGRILNNSQAIELVQIDVLVSSNEGDVIYCGILDRYYLSPDGSIDRIYLSNVYRRRFSNDLRKEHIKTEKESDERYYNMPGDFFVIFGRAILNVNITYYMLSENESPVMKIQPAPMV